MDKLIDLKSYPIINTIEILLKDNTTKRNIIWATDSYAQYGPVYKDTESISKIAILGMRTELLQPRVFKQINDQKDRTKSKAEVFTPTWVCNFMNNHCDEDWFGYPNVFNYQKDTMWETKQDNIFFPKGKKWKSYVDSNRLEITCGEAPYIVSRYDATTGKIISVKNRIGFLDRKLRIVSENTYNEKDWFNWVIRAYQSTYGYEFQGDNLLIARINLLMTFVDNVEYKWNREPTIKELKKIANIISWNLWQMDGLSGNIPLGIPQEKHEQLALFVLDNEKVDNNIEKAPFCKIYDWREKKEILYIDLKRGV